MRLAERVIPCTCRGVLRYRASSVHSRRRQRQLRTATRPQRLPRGLHALEAGKVGVLGGAVWVHAQHLAPSDRASAPRNRRTCGGSARARTHRPVVRLPNLRRRGVGRHAQDVVRVGGAHAEAPTAVLVGTLADMTLPLSLPGWFSSVPRRHSSFCTAPLRLPNRASWAASRSCGRAASTCASGGYAPGSGQRLQCARSVQRNVRHWHKLTAAPKWLLFPPR